MDFIRFLATIALSGGLAFLKVFEVLADCMKDTGFESAEKHLKLSREWEGIEQRLSEWSAIHLERMRDNLLDMKNQIHENETDSEKLSMVAEVISRIEDYISEIRMREKSRHKSKD
jgi:hypothetical protein